MKKALFLYRPRQPQSLRLYWIRQYILFHEQASPGLNHFAVKRGVAGSTHNQECLSWG
jgi:hypothetical protein